MRTRLGVRSAYSILYGVRTPADIAVRAASYGATALSIADKDNLYGVHASIAAAKEAGLKPIVGVELSARGRNGNGSDGDKGSVFCFAENRQGFSRLCVLLSKAKAAPDFDMLAALRNDARGLILASSSPETLAALAGKTPRLFAAVTPESRAAHRQARALGIPLAAIDDASFLDPADRKAHAVLRSIALRKTVGTLADGDEAPSGGLFLPADEFQRRFDDFPEALRGADDIAAACSFDAVFDGFVFPGYPSDDGRNPAAVLRTRVMEGAERRYGELSDAIVDRIDYELDIIERKGFAPYFLTMHDIVGMASRTCGRGSGAASIVSYSLYITNVDPIEHKLYFERFLTMARPDPPDIDVDFAWDERDDLIRRVIARFGADRCARVANHNTFRPRSAFRETAKAYGFADGEISRAERGLLEARERGVVIEAPWDEIMAVADSIEGLPRGLSMHCGGLVITPEPIERYAPVESSAAGYPLLAWEKDGVEEAGLVKLDLLGNRSLAVIRDALANMREQGSLLDLDLWRPADDEATVAALARGDSMGVFYIESPAMRQLQRKTGAGDFEHIVIHSSIIRPAANKLIAEYVERLKGKPWKPLHPRLAGILDETLGIVCYQEDVSKIAIALAGFAEDDADKLRKVISKKAGPAKLALYRDRFFAGAAANGVEEKIIEEVWAMLLSFEGYSFCKPHSASYAMVSFQSAWLRVHRPAEFMAAVLSNQGGYYRPAAYISEARRMGLAVVGPDVNRSGYRYRGEAGSVLVGLMAIAKLSRAASDGIVADRDKRGPFLSLENFSSRLSLGREDIVSLVASGAFDSIAGGQRRSAQVKTLLCAGSGKPRLAGGQGDLFGSAPPASRFVAPILKERSGLTPAAPGVGEMTEIVAPGSDIAKRSDAELRDEFEALGFLRDRHPLSLWANAIARVRRIHAVDIPRYLGRDVTLIGWPVTQKEVLTSGGLVMDFVSFEDESALYETVLFPEAYDKYRRLLFELEPIVVRGTVADDQGALSVQVDSLTRFRMNETGIRKNQSL